MIVQWLIAIVILLGSTISMLAAVGIVRMPDVYMRLHAATKSSTLGVSLLVLSAAYLTESPGAAVRALLIVAFLMMTVPISAHMIGRAAYSSAVALWHGTKIDELRDDRDEYGEGEPLQS